MGHAVRLAAEEARSRLAALAAETGVPPGAQPADRRIVPPKKYGMQAGTIVGAGS